MSTHANPTHRGRNRRRLLAAPLVVIAAGGIAACGSTGRTIVLGVSTTTQCPLGITTCTTTSVEASSTLVLGLSTTTRPPFAGVATTSSEPASSTTAPPTTAEAVSPASKLPETK